MEPDIDGDRRQGFAMVGARGRLPLPSRQDASPVGNRDKFSFLRSAAEPFGRIGKAAVRARPSHAYPRSAVCSMDSVGRVPFSLFRGRPGTVLFPIDRTVRFFL